MCEVHCKPVMPPAQLQQCSPAGYVQKLQQYDQCMANCVQRAEAACTLDVHGTLRCPAYVP